MLSDFLARRVMEPGRRDAVLERTRAIVRRNWPVLQAWIGARSDYLSVAPPRAGAIAFVRYDLPVASIPLCERLRVEKSVLIVPGDQLGTGRHVRIGFGYGADSSYMLAGLDRVDALFSELRAGKEARGRRRAGASSRGLKDRSPLGLRPAAARGRRAPSVPGR
jgi:aspartate/methionine/tyrosine aminotransferase